MSKVELDLSIVVPVYDEIDNVALLHAELDEVLSSMGKSYEILFVDDGSRDGSLAKLRELAAADPSVVVVEFRRNFGQTAALDAGFQLARGRIVIPMDADLQNDPRDIPRLVSTIEDDGYDVVKGWRKDRKDKAISRKLPSFLANKLISWATGVRLHDYGCTLSAFRQEIISEVHLYGEMHRFIPVYTQQVGGRLIELPVNHRPRIHGTTKYNIMRTFRVILDLITVRFLVGYRNKPSYFFGKMGLAAFLLSFVLLGITAYKRLALDIFVKDQPLFLIAVVIGLAGLQIILIGLLAELMMRSYFESTGKQHYAIRKVHRAEPAPGDDSVASPGSPARSGDAASTEP
jgi:glycosyltransferase involved in cell wall biosynthesis